MSVKRVAVWDMWHDETLAEIEKALEGSPDRDERRRRIDVLSASIRSNPPTVEEPVRAAVNSAVHAGVITEEEANRLLAPRS
jgi:hypothetical protein